MGTAPQQTKCVDCGKSSKRYYNSVEFTLVGEGWPGKAMSFDSEMTGRNKRAASRMRDNNEAPKLIAHDYGNGDIREVKPSKPKPTKTKKKKV